VPAEPLLILLVVAAAINVVLVGVVAIAAIRDRRREAAASNANADHAWPPAVAGVFGAPPLRFSTDHTPLDRGAGKVLPEADSRASLTYDRVVRVVSWTFILAATALVALSSLWPATQTAIFLLLALAGVFVVVVHDVLPGSILGSARYVVEGSVAITFATLLLVLTGGSASPFFFAYALIVSGAALILAPRLSVLVTAFAIGAYLVATFADPSRLPLTVAGQVTVGVNVAALVLLTYVGTVIAREQRRSRDVAIELSTVDSLTGLYNRAYLFAVVDREIQRSARSRRGFCLLMMDLDELKPVNDRYGHFHGDRVLRGVSEIIRHGVRRLDTAARYGGDEFVVLLPETDPNGAYVLAEKIRQGVSDLAIETPLDRIRTSLSIGIVTYPEDGRTADELMISADQAMYASKRRGKNRIVGYHGVATMVGGMPPQPVDVPAAERTGSTHGDSPVASRSGARSV
jgi:diguanylate cyclase (GGDEF)-like protein